MAGGALGVLIASWGTQAALKVLPEVLPLAEEVRQGQPQHRDGARVQEIAPRDSVTEMHRPVGIQLDHGHSFALCGSFYACCGVLSSGSFT